MTPPGSTPPQRIRWFRALRITIVFGIFLIVAATTWHDRYRSTRWREPLFVAIYPLAADDSDVTRRYVDGLDSERFEAIDRFFAREAAHQGLHVAYPFKTRLQASLDRLPPRRPDQTGIFATMLWSLKLRYWAWNVSRHAPQPADVRLFVLYHDPALTPTVPHSLGLTKGLIGVVYAFAAPEMTNENNVVIAHELLHTVGATDKYDPSNDAPIFPEGYADPTQKPLFPQRYAELMAGRRVIAAGRWEQVASLNDVVIGPATALEIRWPQSTR